MEQNKIKLLLKTWVSHKVLEQIQETLRFKYLDLSQELEEKQETMWFIYMALWQATESKIKKHWYLWTWLCHKQLEQNQENLKQMFWVHGSVAMCMIYTWIKIPVSTILGLDPTRTYTSKTLQRKTSVDDSIVSWPEVRSTCQCRSYNGNWGSVFYLNPKILILAWALNWEKRIATQVVKTVP